MTPLKLSLYENCKSFTREALEKAILAEKEPRHWQFAILNIVQAIELSLKELLRQTHPAFIYENIDKQKNTVTLDLSCFRRNWKS